MRPVFFDIPDVPFDLSMTLAGSSFDGTGWNHTVIFGSLNIGTAGSELSAALSNIQLYSVGGSHTFSADLDYVMGALIPGSINTGTIEGVFNGPAMALNANYISTGTELFTANVGAVVPVPAGLVLFGSAILGLLGFGRRQQVI